MRLLILSLFTLLFATVFAWDKEDHEIFDLVSAIETSEGKGTTFYSWLDVPSTASTSEIAKAYRKLSMQLHPDKNPGNKKVAARFARLGVVSAILRNPVSRKRYDFFYKNGVPKWRGTGYYYNRFRPGIGTVLTFLIILSSVMQYLFQRSNYKRDLQRIEDVMRDARLAAWGPKMIPVEGQRKVKVNLGGSRQRFDEDGYVIEGKTIDMVVSGDAVYILDPDGDMHPVDSSTAISPSVSRTWFIALVLSAYSSLLNKVKGNTTVVQPAEDFEMVDGYDSTAGSEQADSGTVTPQEGIVGGNRKPTTKAGGKRRKTARKR